MHKRFSVDLRVISGVFLTLCIALSIGRLGAQSATATIIGTVTDTSGAAVPDAAIQVQNIRTGVSQSVASDAVGRYRVAELPVGEYQVQASKMGFATTVHMGITLTVGAQSVIDFSLPIGQQTQTVTVEGEVSQVETTNGAVGSLTDQKQVHELPLNGRNFEQLIQLAPGVQTYSGFNSTALQGRGTLYSVSGARPAGQAILMDDENLQGFSNRGIGSITGSSLGVESIAEFQTLTNSYGAQFAGNGAVINSVTRSGTNAFHGTAYEFFRNDKLDADLFFHAPNGQKQLLRKNQYGGSIGGPIKKDKAFFFVNYEGIQQSQGQIRTALVPGCPAACIPPPSLPTATRQAIINTLALYPLPDPGTVGSNSIGTSVQTGIQSSSENFVLGRMDYTLSSKDSLFGRYLSDKADFTDPFGGGGTAGGPLLGWTEFSNSHNQFFTVEERHIFSPTIVNTFRASFARQVSSARQPANVSVNGTTPLQFFPNRGFGDGGVTISGLSPLGEDLVIPFDQIQNRYTEADDILWSKGAHSLRFGVSVSRFQTNHYLATKQQPIWAFQSGLAAFVNTGLATNVTGVNYNVPGPNYANRDFREIDFTPYFQDDWKVTRKLTLNLGLRWSPMTNPSEVHGALYAITNFTTDTNVKQVEHPFAGNPSWRTFDPRFGFAYDPFADHKTSIRGGFGIFHQPIVPGDYISGFHNAYPWTQYQQNNPLYPTPFAGSVQTQLTLTTGWAYRTDVTPYNMQYNLSIQREIAPATVLMVAYVGSRGLKLLSAIEDNPYPASIDATGLIHFGVNPACPVATQGSQRVNCALGSFSDNTNTGDSRYNSLQTTLNRRFSGNFQVQVAYTFSRCIDDENGGGGGGNTTNGGGFGGGVTNTPSNPYNQAIDKGLCGFDIRHTLRVNGLWALPFHGNRLIEGWQISGIESAYSGIPVNITTGVSRAYTQSPDRPNYVAGCQMVHGDVNQWFNPACFALQPQGTLGNLGRDVAIGPHFFGTDLAVLKDTKIKESLNMQFRAEFFNLFNHANFGLPIPTAFSGAGVPNSQFGKITTIVGTPRQVQLALKLVF